MKITYRNLLALTVLTMALPACDAMGQNLLTNAGFEDYLGGAMFYPGWKYGSSDGSFSFTPGSGADAHTGTNSVGLNDGITAVYSYVYSTSNIAAGPGNSFTLSAWARTEDFNASDGIVLALGELNAAGTLLNFTRGTPVYPGNSDWIHINEMLVATNPSTGRVSAYLIFLNSGLSPSGGTVYFDDASLARVNPTGLVQFSALSCSVNENAGSVTVRVTRIGGSSGSATVRYSTQSGTARDGTSYTGTNAMLSWADGDTSERTATVQIPDTSDYEGQRTFSLYLYSATGATIGRPAGTLVRILDDEPAPPDAPQWSSLGAGVNGPVYACALSGSNLYAGGAFTVAGGVWAKNIAMWNGNSWTNLGSGVNADVKALACDSSGNLYVGGLFTNAGGRAARHVAQWNGSSWTNVGSGLAGNVYAVAVDAAGAVYASTKGSPGSYVYKWSGNAWTNLGYFGYSIFGVEAYVFSLAFDDSGRLCAGGFFDRAAGATASMVAALSGTNWVPVGTGVNTTVYAISPDGRGNLYAGGEFTRSLSGTATNYIAKWNGSVWTNLGSGINPSVGASYHPNSLACDGLGNLYVGGWFMQAGGTWVFNIAKWDGVGWTNLLAGAYGDFYSCVWGMVWDNAGKLYVGGKFSEAGGNCASNIACVLLPATYTPRFLDLHFSTGENTVLTWSSVTNRRYTVRYSTNLTTGFSVLRSNITATSSVNSYTDSVQGVSKRFWQITTAP